MQGEEKEVIRLADRAVGLLQSQQVEQAQEAAVRLGQYLLPFLDFKYGYLRGALEQILKQRWAGKDSGQPNPVLGESQLAEIIDVAIKRLVEINSQPGAELNDAVARLGAVLASLFPSVRIYPDYWLGGSRLDFFIPERRLAFYIAGGATGGPGGWLAERACEKRNITLIKLQPKEVSRVNFRQQLARWLRQGGNQENG